MSERLLTEEQKCEKIMEAIAPLKDLSPKAISPDILPEFYVVYYANGENCVCDCLSMAQIRALGEKDAKICKYTFESVWSR